MQMNDCIMYIRLQIISSVGVSRRFRVHNLMQSSSLWYLNKSCPLPEFLRGWRHTAKTCVNEEQHESRRSFFNQANLVHEIHADFLPRQAKPFGIEREWVTMIPLMNYWWGFCVVGNRVWNRSLLMGSNSLVVDTLMQKVFFSFFF